VNPTLYDCPASSTRTRKPIRGAVAAVVMLTSSSPAAPVDPTWTLIQLTGYDAEGEMVTMPLAYHPYTFLDLIDLPGDANGDGIVDIEDLNLVLTNFGEVR
jgi:hypothetical protein